MLLYLFAECLKDTAHGSIASVRTDCAYLIYGADGARCSLVTLTRLFFLHFMMFQRTLGSVCGL